MIEDHGSLEAGGRGRNFLINDSINSRISIVLISLMDWKGKKIETRDYSFLPCLEHFFIVLAGKMHIAICNIFTASCYIINLPSM